MKRVGFSLAMVMAMVTGVVAQERGMVLSVAPALAVLGREIAPASVSVIYPGPPEINASDWRPDDAMLRRYQRADLVLLVGADYAGWIAATTLPRARLINTSAAFSDQFIEHDTDVPDHQHGPSGAASHHAAYANHFWFDPALAQMQAETIAETFTALWPQYTDEIAINLAGLTAQLAQIELDLAAEFSGLDGVNILASHPVYQYLDRAHGLGLRSFHWEPDQHPTPEDWAALDAALATDRPNMMIWEASPLPETRAELERRDIEIIVISPSVSNHQNGHLRSRLGFPDHIGISNRAR